MICDCLLHEGTPKTDAGFALPQRWKIFFIKAKNVSTKTEYILHKGQNCINNKTEISGFFKEGEGVFSKRPSMVFRQVKIWFWSVSFSIYVVIQINPLLWGMSAGARLWFAVI